MPTGAPGPKRRDDQDLQQVQAGNLQWWQSTPMDYDWAGSGSDTRTERAWFNDQDERFMRASDHFATDKVPFDRFIPYARLANQEVLEIGTGSGFHSELMAKAGARVTGIDLTDTAIARTKARFGHKKLDGHFDQWDAELPRPEFRQRFDCGWSWGVVHHSSRTARIIRNVAEWMTEGGEFRGMGYNRSSLPAITSLFGRAVVAGRDRKEPLWGWRVQGYGRGGRPADPGLATSSWCVQTRSIGRAGADSSPYSTKIPVWPSRTPSGTAPARAAMIGLAAAMASR